MSELIRTALLLLPRHKKPAPPLPVFRSGGALADIANRAALCEAMEEVLR